MNNEIMLNENESTTKNALELRKTYRLSGYDWTACELVNNGRTAVIQSHGVTHGTWPGYKMKEFDSEYSIDGHDISGYDDKTQALYDTIKDVEDKSALYGKGLYLVSKEKVGCTERGELGSGNYWQALKTAAANYRSFGFPGNYSWLGTAAGYSAWCVDRSGSIYGNNFQHNDFVVAPAFNLDLSKVKIVEDEIMIKGTFEKTNTGKSLALEKRVKKARLILAVTEQVSEDDFERHYKTVEIEVPENERIDLSKCNIVGGEWIS